MLELSIRKLIPFDIKQPNSAYVAEIGGAAGYKVDHALPTRWWGHIRSQIRFTFGDLESRALKVVVYADARFCFRENVGWFCCWSGLFLSLF